MGILSNKLFRQVGTLAIAAVIGALVWGLINQIMSVDSVQDAVSTVATGAFTDDSEFLGPVILTTGASITKCREGSDVSCRDVTYSHVPSFFRFTTLASCVINRELSI